MKKLILIFSISISLVSCKSFEEQVRSRGNYVDVKSDGYVVEYFGYNPSDTLIDKYPINDSDSLSYFYDLDTKQTLIYVIEETRYVILNENLELLRFESK
jgi:hypothetical protein